MEYEKKYNDLIARINAVKDKPRIGVKDEHYYNGYVETGIRDALDYIVSPESEDERIRTRLIALVESFGQGTYKNEMLAYLEKQKEQKPESCDCSRDEESYTNGIHHVLMNPEAYGLIKQKPAEQLSGTFTSYDMAKTFTEGQNYVIAHPEKFGLCKPAEWSEEDERAINDLMWCIDAYRKGAFNEMHIERADRAENWLKSSLLRPQPHWKPSKEQMDHLAYAYTQLKLQKCYAPHVYESLGSLYDDLKKLI